MISPSIDAIEQNISQAKAHIEFAAAVERLRSNKDFRKVVLEGYFEREAVRLVHLKGDPNMQSADSQRSIVQQMDAIAAFSAFLNTALHLSALAAKSIADDEEMRDEILAEELSNG